MKIVCLSDTHGQHRHLRNIPEGDMIICAGDIGRFKDVEDFADWYLGLDFRYRILIAGNHDFFFEQAGERRIKEVLTDDIIYLNESGVEIEGIKIWGSPITPKFFDWAFMKDRGIQIAKHWNLIPNDTDILITHGPPDGILDLCPSGHAGCYDLLKKVKKVKPKYHIFGHIHESHGVRKVGKTTFVNATVLNGQYLMVYDPIVFEY